MRKPLLDQLFIFTASEPVAYQHYIDTIEEGFPLKSVSSFLPTSDSNNLTKIYGSELVRAWGALPGKGNRRNWQTMQLGDPILTYRKGIFEYYAFVTYKAHHQRLAEHLWKLDDKTGQTWEYMYFLDHLTEVSVPLEIFTRLVGYKEHPRGFMRINEARTIRWLV